LFIIAVENFILFSTLLALLGFALAWSARAFTTKGWWKPHPNTLTRLYAAMLALPPVFAAWIVATALLPESLLGEASFRAAHAAPLHDMHLLSDLTARLDPMLAYATVSFAVAVAIFVAWSGVRGSMRVGRVIEKLEVNAAPPPPEQISLVEQTAARYCLDVGLVMSDYPFTFVWGFWRSKLVLSSGLLRTLSPSELAGVLEHEAAHHERRDNLAKLLLSAASYTSLAFPLSRLILRWRGAEVEIVCDEVAAGRTSAPLEIADALVKLRRQTLTSSEYTPAGALASDFVPDDSPSVERRVRRLVRLADAVPTPTHVSALSRTQKAEAIMVASIFTMTLMAASLYAPLAVHTAAESIIQLLR
jgi:Zn-dependent protease with chaperone function